MKKLYTLSLCFALLVLAACGENWYGSSSGSGSDIKSLRIDAENAFRKGKFEESFNICKKITGIDPASSFGYYGMAKAGLWQYGVSPMGMFSLIKPTKDSDECPFMGGDVTVKERNDYLQAMRKIFDALTELDRRDSLTALYEFHERAKKDKNWANDTTFIVTIDDKQVSVDLNRRLSDFRGTFCGGASNGDCRDTTSNDKRKFPISDREFKGSYFGGILLLSSFSKWFLDFFDTNYDGCLTRKGEPGVDYPGNAASEWKKWGDCEKDKYDLAISMKCIESEDGMSVTIDSKQILEDLEDDLSDYYKDIANGKNAEIPDQIKDLNDKIDNFGDAFGDVASILDAMGLGGSGDPDIDQGSLKDEIDKYKAYASFYRMGTHFDEDGDGCIDEELLDGQDNDGDGFSNENARLAPTDPQNPYWGISQVNNYNPYKDETNKKEYNMPMRLKPEAVRPICNDRNYTNCPPPQPDSTGFVTVIGFTQKNYPDGTRYWTTNDANLKLDVVQDKDCSKYSLNDRKQKIGGCWPYYGDTEFRKYCNDARSR